MVLRFFLIQSRSKEWKRNRQKINLAHACSWILYCSEVFVSGKKGFHILPGYTFFNWKSFIKKASTAIFVFPLTSSSICATKPFSCRKLVRKFAMVVHFHPSLILAGKSRVWLHFKSRLLAILANIRLGSMRPTVINTQTYYYVKLSVCYGY